MRHIFTALPVLFATPALAASGPFFSLGNTDFVVTISFIVFIAVLLYLGVPKLVGGLLEHIVDGRTVDRRRSDTGDLPSLGEHAQNSHAPESRSGRFRLCPHPRRRQRCFSFAMVSRPGMPKDGGRAKRTRLSAISGGSKRFLRVPRSDPSTPSCARHKTVRPPPQRSSRRTSASDRS